MTSQFLAYRPHDFEKVFIEHGWRGVERIFGARTSVLVRWIDDVGGLESLQARRRAYRAQLRADQLASNARR